MKKTLILIFLLCSGCSQNNSLGTMVVSISTDGKYIITSSADKKIVLWGVKNKSVKMISNNANIYSAYFIKNKPWFMWQDLNNIVHIQDVNGNEIYSFQNFPSYGHVISADLKKYFASSINWSIIKGSDKNQKIVLNNYNQNGFEQGEKLLNMMLSSDNKKLLMAGAMFNSDDVELPLSAGFDAFSANIIKYKTPNNNFSLLTELTLWDADLGKPVYKFTGLIGKSFATFSPDGKYIVGGDEDSHSFVWDIKTGKRLYQVDFLGYGKYVRDANCPLDTVDVTCFHLEDDGIVKPPKRYLDEWSNGDPVLSLKFIDLNGDYLRFTLYTHYAILFNVKSPKPIKYIYLGKYPDLVTTTFYDRNAAIDTAPAANILVIGKKYTSGIVVYKYDPKTQTLKKIWSPNLYSLPREWWEIFRKNFR